MDNPLGTVIIVVSLVLAGWAGVLVARNRGVTTRLIVGTGVLELLMLALVVVGLVQTFTTTRDVSKAIFVGYLVGGLIIPPAGLVWSIEERNRYGSAVMLAVFVVMPIMIIRMRQVWGVPLV